jgi:hypothetical protein
LGPIFYFQKTPITVPFAASLYFSCQDTKIHGEKKRPLELTTIMSLLRNWQKEEME